MDYLSEAVCLKKTIQTHRQNLHRIPELGLTLPKTAQYIEKILDQLDIRYKKYLDGNAFTALIGTRTEKGCVALRADMDALPIAEQTQLSFTSEHSGCMHACGHDGHMAILLGAAEILKKHEDELNGVVKLIFQPGEEFPGGALPMINAGCLDHPKVNGIFGLHNGNLLGDLPRGHFGFYAGAMMASMDRFKITVQGKGGHGAKPHECIDPICIISEINLALQTIISRRIPPTQNALISVCQIHGGTTQNIIPDMVWEEGTVRTLNTEIQDLIEENIKKIVQGICASYGAVGKVDYERYYPVLTNDPACTQFAYQTAKALFNPDKIHNLEEPTMGGEDMSFFLQNVPGTYFIYSNQKPHKDGKIYPHHNSKFDIDDSVLYEPCALLCQLADRFFKDDSNR